MLKKTNKLGLTQERIKNNDGKQEMNGYGHGKQVWRQRRVSVAKLGETRTGDELRERIEGGKDE